MKLKGLIIIVILLMAGLAVGFVLLVGKDSKPGVPVVTEVDSPGMVIIDNTDQLSEILLSNEYQAVLDALTDYIFNELSPDVQHAAVTDGPRLEPSGSLSFELTADGHKPFSARIDRETYKDRVILTIPASNYERIIQVY